MFRSWILATVSVAAVLGVFPAGPVADSERKISIDMQTCWTNYAKTGDRNGAGLSALPKCDTKCKLARHTL